MEDLPAIRQSGALRSWIAPSRYFNSLLGGEPQSPEPRSPGYTLVPMTLLGLFGTVVGLAFWLGSVVFFWFFVTPVLSKRLVPGKMAELMGVLNPRYYFLSYICGLLMLIGAIQPIRAETTRGYAIVLHLADAGLDRDLALRRDRSLTAVAGPEREASEQRGIRREPLDPRPLRPHEPPLDLPERARDPAPPRGGLLPSALIDAARTSSD